MIDETTTQLAADDIADDVTQPVDAADRGATLVDKVAGADDDIAGLSVAEFDSFLFSRDEI